METSTGVNGIRVEVDSLYLSIRYPHSDIYRYWLDKAGGDLEDGRLREGIPDGTNCLIRYGGNGYKLSVWDGDFRIFLSPRVDDVLKGTSQEGQGMGILVQIGPKWLSKYGWVRDTKQFHQNIYGQLASFGIGEPDYYEIRVKRLDIRSDLVGVPFSAFENLDILEQWVGSAKPRVHHYGEGLQIGSRKSNIILRLYNKVKEAQGRKTLDFWNSVWGRDESEEQEPVTRIEWSVRCYDAGFVGIRYLEDLSYANIDRILNYLVNEWGRIVIPSETDSNKRRWEIHPLWEVIIESIKAFRRVSSIAKRQYDYNADLSEAYIKQFAGWLGGFKARLGVKNKRGSPSTLGEVLDFMHEMIPQSDIDRRTLMKFEQLSATMAA